MSDVPVHKYEKEGRQMETWDGDKKEGVERKTVQRPPRSRILGKLGRES